MYCKVKGCRFPHSHTTKSHLCSKCKNFGHGQIECNNYHMKENLKKFFNDKLPSHLCCTFFWM